MGVNLEQIATEANSTDFVSSICPELGKKALKNPIWGKFRKRPKYIHSHIHYFSHVNRVKILTFRYHHENH